MEDIAPERAYLPQMQQVGRFVRDGEGLKMTVFNSVSSVTAVLRGRFMRNDGTIERFRRELVPATDRSASSVTLNLSEGWLLSAHLIASGAAPLLGQAYGILSIVTGLGTVAEEIETLASGYFNAVQRVAYPDSGITRSLDGPGALRSITGTDPAANAEISETVPTGARWRLISMGWDFVTDANVANRVVTLSLDDGTSVYFKLSAQAVQTASNTFSYTASSNGFSGSNSDNRMAIALPTTLVLGAGHRIKTLTLNRQVTDNHGAPQLFVEEWIEAA